MDTEPPRKKTCPESNSTRSQYSAQVRCFDLKPLQCFCETQLPTNSDAIRRYFAIHDKAMTRPKREITESIFNELAEIWAKISFPLKIYEKRVIQ